jgi:hypothetical protein
VALKLVYPPRLSRADLPILGPALGVCLLSSVFFVWRNTFTIAGHRYLVLYDDAMISMRYARNLAAGSGLVWNPGKPPVEGYTNFLWTLWMALIHLTGVDETKSSLAVAGSGAFILLGNAFLVWTIARSLAPAERWVAGVATWLTVLCYPVLYWTLVGLEVGLLTLLNSAAILLALRLRRDYHRRDLGVLAAVMSAGILTRTDQLVSCVVILGFVALAIPRTRRVEAVAVLCGAMLATVSLHTAIRLSYYGEPLPNTYYLKTQNFSLVTRLSRGLAALIHSWLIFFTPVLVLAAVGLVKWARRVGAPLLLLLAIFGGQCAYSVSVGGDAWEWYNFPNRYVTSGIPALLVLSACGVASLVGAPLRTLVPSIAGLSALLGGGYWLGRQVDEFLRQPKSVPNVSMLVFDDATTPIRQTIALQSGWVLWAARRDDVARIKKYGYERILPQVFVRSDSRLVDRVALERIVCALAPEGRIEGPGKGDWTWDWEEIRDRRCGDDPLALR